MALSELTSTEVIIVLAKLNTIVILLEYAPKRCVCEILSASFNVVAAVSSFDMIRRWIWEDVGCERVVDG